MSNVPLSGRQSQQPLLFPESASATSHGCSIESQVSMLRSNMDMLIGQVLVCVDNMHNVQMRLDALDREMTSLRAHPALSSGANNSNNFNGSNPRPGSTFPNTSATGEQRVYWSGSPVGAIQTPLGSFPTSIEERNAQIINSMTSLGLTPQPSMGPPPSTNGQREDAIMSMLSSNALPGETPTAQAPTFPSSSTEAMMFSNGMQQVASVMPQGFPFPPSVTPFDPSSGMQPMRTPTQVNAPQPMPGAGPVPANSNATAQNFQSYVLDPARANNELLDHACMQHWIKELSLKGCKNISNFTPLSRLRTLWKLNLQGCSQYVDDHVVKLISTYNKRLSRINLCGCDKVTDATPLAQLGYLFDVNLSGCQISNESLVVLAENCHQLSRLAINSCPKITDISCIGKMKELKLLYCRYSDNIDPASIAHVLNMISNNLLTLNIDGIKFKSMELQLTGVSAIRNLNLKDNTEMFSLDWLLNDPEPYSFLEMLDAEGCSNLKDLSNISRLQSLKLLRVSYTAIDDVALKEIASGAPNLITLFVESCPNITDFSALANHPSLKKLHVDTKLFAGRSTNNLFTLMNGRMEVVAAAGPHRTEGNSAASGDAGLS